MGESRVQGLQCCCGKISMRPQDKLKWPPWFNTPEEDGCNNVDLSHSWGSWKKWCVQAAGMRSPILHNLAVIGRIFKFERSTLHNCIHSTGSAKFCLSIPEQKSAARVYKRLINHNSQGVLDFCVLIAWKKMSSVSSRVEKYGPKKAGGDVTEETKHQTGYQNWCSCGFQDKFAQGLHRASPWESTNHIKGGAVLLISQRGKVLPSNQPCDFPKTGTLPAGRYRYCSVNVKVQNREGQLMFRWHKINPVKILLLKLQSNYHRTLVTCPATH